MGVWELEVVVGGKEGKRVGDLEEVGGKVF